MRQNGVIAKLVKSKNYGHVDRADGSSVFVHASNYNGSFADLSVGDKIEFTLGQFQGRPTAKEVTVVSKATGGELHSKISRKQVPGYAGATAELNVTCSPKTPPV